MCIIILACHVYNRNVLFLTQNKFSNIQGYSMLNGLIYQDYLEKRNFINVIFLYRL